MNSTAEIMAKLASMSAAEKAGIDALLAEGPIWVPQQGPQVMAYASKADILFYGGSAGGGKTDLMLGLCLTDQDQSIIFRREAVQLIGIEKRMTSILGTRKGYNSQDGVWNLPGGKCMELGSVKEPDDWIKYQGRPHDIKCVGRGTLVRMSDGRYKPMESIVVGDFVATLEGSKAVTKTFVMRKQAVTAKMIVSGRVIAEQVQSRTHRILSPSGWVCRDTSMDHGASSPTQHHGVCKSEGLSLQTSGQTSSIPQEKCLDLAQQQEQPQGRAGCQLRSGSCAASEVSNQGTGFAAFVYRLSGVVQRSSKNALQVLLQPFAALLGQGLALPFSAHGATDVLSGSSLADFQVDCSSDPRRDGEQPHADPGRGLQCLLLLVDAGQQNPKDSASDGQGKTPTHTRRIESYAHPYTKEKRRIQAEFLEASLQFHDAGEQDLFDLTVADANHYITAGGIVNSNCFDEICHFTEMQFRTLIGWMRTDNPSIRQRVVCAGNPPTDAAGEWVKRYWAAWLDPNHHNPAKPGELRWYVSDEKGMDMEVPGPEPVMVGPELMTPKSRTFIPSSVDDNLFLSSTGYKATLQSLPEPLRSQMLRGDFNAGTADPAWQLIPTEWVKAAQARWKYRVERGPMTVLGLDPCRGGRDKTGIARRHGQWFDKMISIDGSVTKDGPSTAGVVVPLVRNGAPIAVDGIGIGSSALDFLVTMNLLVHAVIGSEGSTQMDKMGNLRFRNKRAEMYWRLREALDPEAAEPIYLPPDAELMADLCAVRYKVVTMGQKSAIQIRDKDEIREVLGRSPDKGDAVAMTFAADIPRPAREAKKASWRDRLAITGRQQRGSAQAA